MATGEGDGHELSHCQLNAGNELFNYLCTPCQKRTKQREALKYCAICMEYMCTECVDSHGSFKTLSKHSLVDVSMVRRTSHYVNWGHLLSVPTEMCKKHPMKVVDMYCENDRCVGCSICIASHKCCSDVHYIPEYVKSLPNSAVDNQIICDLMARLRDVSTLKVSQNKLKNNLAQDKAQCKQKIQNIRTEIKKVVDKLEEMALEELDEAYEKLNREFADRIKKIEETENELARLKGELGLTHDNASQQFAVVMVSKEVLTASVAFVSSLNAVENNTLDLDENIDILKQLQKFESLVSLYIVKMAAAEIRNPDGVASDTAQNSDQLSSPVTELSVTSAPLIEPVLECDTQQTSDPLSSVATLPASRVLQNLDTRITEGSDTCLPLMEIDVVQMRYTNESKQETVVCEYRETVSSEEIAYQTTNDPVSSINTPSVSDASQNSDTRVTEGPVTFEFNQEKVSCENKESGFSEDLAHQTTSDATPSVYIPQYVVNNMTRHNVGIQADKMTCNISSVYILDDGNLLMTDFNNKSIKEIDKNKCRVIDSISVSSGPICISRVNARESVVSLQSRTIQFIARFGLLSSTRSFKTGHRCCGLAVIKNYLYVCDDNTSVHVYTLNGDRIKTIRYRSETCSFPLSHMYNDIAFDESSDTIFICDFEDLTAMDIEGKRLWQRTDMKSQPTGLCCDNRGNLFVCGRSAGNVVLVNQDGEDMNEIVGRRDGLRYPSSVCFDKESTELVLGMQSSNEILVFSLSCFIKTHL